MNAEARDAGRLRELARLCRSDAKRSRNPETQRLLLAKADEYEREAAELERPAD
jgi:hypothetical protein